MWIVINREPRPDAQQWAGRQWLAAADAIAWPIAWVVFLLSTPLPAGLVGQVVVALAAWAGLNRAIWPNHRYWFTTWRLGRVLLAIMLMGWVMKLAAPGRPTSPSLTVSRVRWARCSGSRAS